MFIDGGFRRGTEVLKALSLGASAVFLNRPIAWGLCYNGKDGVKDLVDMLNEELKLAMALTNSMDIS